jgi:hypothetical protein
MNNDSDKDTGPFGDVWAAFLEQCHSAEPLPDGWMSDDKLFAEYMAFCRAYYRDEILAKRERYEL